MKKILLVSVLAALPSFLYAATNSKPELTPDQRATCYRFDKDTVIDTGTCIVSAGTVSGGNYFNLSYRHRNYEFVYAYSDDSVLYTRDGLFRRKHFDDIDENELLYCFKNHPYDICYMY